MIQCPSCGGALRFDIPSQMMVCEYCGSSCDPAATAVVNKEAEKVNTFETYSYICPSCGGELLTTDKTDAIGFCPFCGGASMLFDRIHQEWEPQYIIPFRITKEDCKKAYVQHAEKAIFSSKKYRDPQLIDGFRGIYMPYFNYQAIQKGKYVLYGETKGVFVRKEYVVSGETDVRLDGYAHDASLSFDDRMSENIAPFDPAGHRPFAPGYLSGFYADVGDVDQNTYTAAGIKCMRESTAGIMGEDPAVKNGAGKLHPLCCSAASASVPTQIVSAERVLYPVWFMSYRNKDKVTYAAVNGQTGKVTADLPMSPWKILIAVLILGAALAALLFMLPSVKANWTLAATVILLTAGTVILHINYKDTIGPLTGLGETEEAKRFKKREKLCCILAAVAAVIGIVVAFLELTYEFISYGMCIVLAAVFFYMMYGHIRFQVEIAKREPPQFHKKGAVYDEA